MEYLEPVKAAREHVTYCPYNTQTMHGSCVFPGRLKYHNSGTACLPVVIFHVATLMPTRSSDLLCSNKKLHIGNNFVTIAYNNSQLPYAFGTIKVS